MNEEVLIIGVLGLVAAVAIAAAFGTIGRRCTRQQRECFHHDIGGNPANLRPATSWIQQTLIETGKRKMFWCDEKQGGCGQTWFT